MTVIVLSPLSIRSDHGNFINSCAICLAIRMCLLAFPGTLAPVHLLWRVLRPGINCQCTYEHGSQLAPSRRH